MDKVQKHIQTVREALHIIATTSGNKRYDAIMRLNESAEGWLETSIDLLEQQQREIDRMKGLQVEHHRAVMLMHESNEEKVVVIAKLQEELTDKDREIEQLRRALAIYADENHYVTDIGGMRIKPTAMIDKGAVAREALFPKEDQAPTEEKGVVEECYICKGRGYTESENHPDCPMCSGAGYVEVCGDVQDDR